METTFTYYAEKEQRERRSEIINLVVENMECSFNDNGHFLNGKMPHSLRLMLHTAMTYLWEGSKERIALANHILNTYLPDQEFCHFSPFLCMQIFYHCGEKLQYSSIEKMDTYCLKWLDSFTEPALEVIGCNDNYPLMAAAALLGGGLRYGRDYWVQAAAKRMEQLDKLLIRRGFSSEYTSNTYTPIQALCLSEIAEFSAHPQVIANKRLNNVCTDLLTKINAQALAAEARIHLDLLTHMHWETAQLGGACSRGYARDICAATSHARFLYYMLYGKALVVDPVLLIVNKNCGLAGEVARNDEDFLRLMFAWHAMAQYHCPFKLGQWAMHKKYPYTVIGTAESVSGRDYPPMSCAPEPSSLMPEFWEYPEHVNLITTYMTADYCLGTARYGWLGGTQSHNLQLLYRKQSQVTGQHQVGAMFTRYVINDHEIFNDAEYVNWEMGVCVTQQKENTAIALYSPRMLYDRDIKSLKMTVNFTDFFGDGLDEIWIGDRLLQIPEGGTTEDECIYIRSGELYLCLKPLMQSPPDRNLRCVVRRVNKLIEISFINYCGVPKSFERMNLAKITNGVAVEVRTAGQYKSFHEFRLKMQPKTDDYLFDYFGRAVRKFRYQNDGKILENEYSPLSLEMRYAMENGQPVLEPKLYSSDPLPRECM